MTLSEANTERINLPKIYGAEAILFKLTNDRNNKNDYFAKYKVKNADLKHIIGQVESSKIVLEEYYTTNEI